MNRIARQFVSCCPLYSQGAGCSPTYIPPIGVQSAACQVPSLPLTRFLHPVLLSSSPSASLTILFLLQPLQALHNLM